MPLEFRMLIKMQIYTDSLPIFPDAIEQFFFDSGNGNADLTIFFIFYISLFLHNISVLYLFEYCFLIINAYNRDIIL